MKKTLSRLLAIAAAITMVFAFGVTAFAANGIPEKTDTGSITVKNVTTEGAVVTAYKIIEATYGANDQYFVGWNDLSGQGLVNDDGTVTITADQLKNISTTGLQATALSKSGDDYTGSGFGAGTYLIRVTNSGTDIYNDMVVSLGYGADGNLVSGTVDADGNFYNFENGTPGEAIVYAKKTEETVDKDYDNTTDQSVQVGDSVPFTITTTIPSYDASVETAVFTVTDTASAGLTLPAADGITVTVGGTPVTSPNAVVAVNTEDNTFTVTFASDYVKGLAAADAASREVKITYNATINESALQTNIGEFDNDARIDYTNESGTTSETTPKTHEYTFNYNGDGNVAKKVKAGESGNEALSGAEFTIYTDAECTQILTTAATDGTSITDENGAFFFNGLDADKTYYIKETKAPEGYSQLTGTMTISFAPTYNEDGTLLSYTVTTVDFNGDTRVVTYEADAEGTDAAVTTTYNAANDRTDILNTKIPALPSTGGMGTYLFTIIGVAVMVVGAAAILLIIRNKKKAEQ